MKPWFFYLFGGFLAEKLAHYSREKKIRERKKLAKHLSEIDRMDIPEIEKEALKRDIKRQYHKDGVIRIEDDDR